MQSNSYDVLVIGSGAAGMRAAIAAGEAGASVGVLSKGSPGKKTATIFSGGVFAGSAGGSTPGAHRRQTLKAGRGINQIELVDVLVSESSRRLEELVDWDIDAEFHRGYLFARGRPPVWGRAIIDCLASRCSGLAIDFHPALLVTRLQTLSPGFAAHAYRPAAGDWVRFDAKAIILATGGAAALFARHDNPGRMLGDGWVLALEAGALLQDLEFVQFYPLGLFEPGLPGFLIPPRLADLGRLCDRSGRDIYSKYGITERPAGEKARDKLSQALFTEIYLEKGEVLLDASGLTGADWCEDPFSASTVELLGERYGARHRPVRVAPMAHHTMGGVVIDADGASSVPGLFAAGEVTGGLHGANRMGGNALTETVVFGRRAGEAAARYAGSVGDSRLQAGFSDDDRRVRDPGASAAQVDFPAQLDLLRRSMWADGGIIRSAEGLGRLLATVENLGLQAGGTLPGDPRRVVGHLELRFALKAAELIALAALKRAESRGAHFRSEHPARNDRQWRAHLQVRRPGEENLDWGLNPC